MHFKFDSMNAFVRMPDDAICASRKGLASARYIPASSCSFGKTLPDEVLTIFTLQFLSFMVHVQQALSECWDNIIALLFQFYN